MRYILWKIRSLQEKDLQKLMHAIEQRYAEVYPDWDIYYIALHKDPSIRKEEIEKLKKLIDTPPEEQESDGLPF